MGSRITAKQTVINLLKENKDIEALRIAHKWAFLCSYRESIQLAWDSRTNPALYRQMKYNVESLWTEGIEALCKQVNFKRI
jgi:hypothetical protein